MRIDRLTMAGFFHFREPATVVFSDLPDGLIALIGPNGHGKTRLLDAGLASLYGPSGGPRAFPSREGPLVDYATARDAFIETEWELEGEGHYVARVNVDGVRRVTDAVLLQAGVPLNDGKATTFREAVDARFPSKRSVLCSAFAAQNKTGSFVELGQKERLELFAELADLGHYAIKAETAKRCAEACATALMKLDATLDVLARETSDEAIEAERQNATQWQEERQTQENRRFVAAAAVNALTESRAALERDARECAVAESEAKAAHDRLLAVRADIATLGTSLARALQDHQAQVKDLTERIAGNHTLLAQADEIRRQAIAALEEQQNREALQKQLDENERDLTTWREMVRDSERTLDALNRKLERLKDARQQADIVATVPCGGTGEYAACRFLTVAAEAREQIADLERDTSIVASEGDTLQHRTRNASVCQALSDELRRQLMAVGVRIADLTLAKYEPELARVEERVAGYEARKAQADDAFDRVRHDVDARTEHLAAEAYETQSRLACAQEIVTRLRQSQQRLDAIDVELIAQRAAVTSADKCIAIAEAALDATFRHQAVIEQKRQVADEARRRRALAEQEQLAWQMLAKACGRDGLPKLEIDAAGPTVSGYCNELLASAFGTRFALEVVTQLPTADGKGVKEGFTIQVLDNAHGGEARDIADLSGGERVIVEEALRAALACYVNSRNRQPIETLWRDETTGALDPENAPRYVAMLRTLVRLSGARQCLFVTHAPECAALADAQIRVETGQPTVMLPPYAE